MVFRLLDNLRQFGLHPINALNKIDNFYDYEKEFVGIMKDLGQEVLEKNISSVPADRRKKKHLPNLGK
jgi:hypothetical protein